MDIPIVILWASPLSFSLQKFAHAIYRDFFQLKKWKFYQKIFDVFNIIAQNIDCGYYDWDKKQNRYTPAHPSFAT